MVTVGTHPIGPGRAAGPGPTVYGDDFSAAGDPYIGEGSGYTAGGPNGGWAWQHTMINQTGTDPNGPARVDSATDGVGFYASSSTPRALFITPDLGSADMYVQFRINQVQSNAHHFAIGARFDRATPLNFNFVSASMEGGGPQIRWTTWPGENSTGSWNAYQTCALGNLCRVEVQGSAIKLWSNYPSEAAGFYNEETDVYNMTGQAAGIWARAANTLNVPIWSEFECGTL